MLHLYKFLFAETLWTSTNCAKLFLLIKSISIVMYTFIPLWGNLCRNSCLTLKCSQQTDKKIPLITCVGVKDVTFVDLTTNYTNDVIYGHCTGKKQMIRLFLVEQYWGFSQYLFFSVAEFSQIIFMSNSQPTQNGERQFPAHVYETSSTPFLKTEVSLWKPIKCFPSTQRPSVWRGFSQSPVFVTD